MAKTAKLLRQVRKRVRAAEKRGSRWRPRGSDLRVLASVTRLFRNITAKWNLTAEQRMAILGGERVRSTDQWTRVKLIADIYASLHILLPRTADDWVLKENTGQGFNGRPAVELMGEGVKGLEYVRNYLRSQCGW